MVSFKKLAVAATAAAGASAQDSICDKYTKALLTNNTAANQYTLLTLLVKTAVIGNFTGNGTQLPMLPGSMVNVPGILAPGEVNGTRVELAGYFNGSLESTNVDNKPTAVNWLDLNVTMAVTNATYIGDSDSMAYALLSHLFSYFGAALGCSTYGMDGFPAYAGVTGMTDVHKYMAIDSNENTYFVQQVGLAAQSFGASDEDIMAVGSLLLTTFNQRCSAPAAVLPNADMELQAICLDSSCPTATVNATCSAYPTDAFTAYDQISTSPATTSMSGGMTGTSTTSGGMTNTAAASSSMSTSSGAAFATGVPAALAVMAGAAAFIL